MAQQDIIEKLRKIIRVSDSMRQDQLRNILKMDEASFNEKIVDWAEQFKFRIDREYINFAGSDVGGFIEELDHQFQQWNQQESSKTGKVTQVPTPPEGALGSAIEDLDNQFKQWQQTEDSGAGKVSHTSEPVESSRKNAIPIQQIPSKNEVKIYVDEETNEKFSNPKDLVQSRKDRCTDFTYDTMNKLDDMRDLLEKFEEGEFKEKEYEKVVLSLQDLQKLIKNTIPTRGRFWSLFLGDIEWYLERLNNASQKKNLKTLIKAKGRLLRDSLASWKDSVIRINSDYFVILEQLLEKDEQTYKPMGVFQELSPIDEQQLNEIIQEDQKSFEKNPDDERIIKGYENIISAFQNLTKQAKYTITLVTPIVEPEIATVLSEFAYNKKSVKFFYITHFDLNTWAPIINKMKILGNIQFRQFANEGDYWVCLRDGEEVLYGPNTTRESLILTLSKDVKELKTVDDYILAKIRASSRPIQ